MDTSDVTGTSDVTVTSDVTDTSDFAKSCEVANTLENFQRNSQVNLSLMQCIAFNFFINITVYVKYLFCLKNILIYRHFLICRVNIIGTLLSSIVTTIFHICLY